MPTTSLKFRLIGEDDASNAFLRAAAAADVAQSSFSDLGSSALGLTRLIGGASLIPIAAGAAGALVELSVAATAAAGAGGVLGLSVAGVVKGMVTQEQQIKATGLHLQTLTKGTSAYKAELDKLHTQQKTFNSDFGPAAKGWADVTSGYQKFEQATRADTLKVMHDGLELVAGVLPRLAPVANSAAHSVDGLIGSIEHWVQSPAFGELLFWLETSGPKDITAFGHIVGNTVSGLAGILGNFVGPGDHAAHTLERLSASFDRWGHSKGVSQDVNRFLGYMAQNGPRISSTLESLARATPKIAVALGHLGDSHLFGLPVTTKFLDLVSRLPQKGFDVVVTGLFGIAAGMKAIEAAKGLAGLAGAIGLLTGLKSGKGGLTKGIAGGLGSVGGKGVVPVYVTNKGFGGPGGLLGDAEKAGGGAAAVTATDIAGAAAGALAAIGISAGTIYALIQESKSGRGAQAGGMSSAQWRNFNNSRMQAMYGPSAPQIASIKSVGTALDGVKARAAAASRSLDLIGPHAEQTSKRSVKAIQTIGNEALTGAQVKAAKAAQAIEQIGPHAQSMAAAARGAIVPLNGALAAVGNQRPDLRAYKASLAQQLEQAGGIARAGGAQVGNDMGSGLNSAVAGWTGSIARTSADLVSNAILAARKAAEAKSPSRKMIRLGHDMMDGLTKGLEDRSMALSKVLTTLQANVQQAFSKLHSDVQARNQFAAGFQSFASSVFGANYGTDANGNPIAPTVASILAYQQSQAQQAAMVKADVQRLVKMGLSPALLKQLQAQGAAAMPELQVLAGATPAQIAALNASNAVTSHDLRGAGMTVANRLYGRMIAQDRRQATAEQRLLREIRDGIRGMGKGQLVAKLNGGDLEIMLMHHQKKQGGRPLNVKTKH